MLYADGVIKLVNNNSFVNRTSGDTVSWFKNYIQTTEGTVLEVGSKSDYSAAIDKPAVFEIKSEPDTEYKNKFKLQLVKVTLTEKE